MLLKAIKLSEHGELAYLSFIEPKAELTVYSRDAEKLSVGEEISDEELSYLTERSQYYLAVKRALAILSYGDNTCVSLKRKLVMKGFSRKVSDEAVEYMLSLGYINESQQLQRLVLREANEALFGKKKILARLLAKGYSMTDIRAVIRSLSDSGEIDFDKNFSLLLSRKLKDGTDEEIQKIRYKYGY